MFMYDPSNTISSMILKLGKKKHIEICRLAKENEFKLFKVLIP